MTICNWQISTGQGIRTTKFRTFGSASATVSLVSFGETVNKAEHVGDSNFSILYTDAARYVCFSYVVFLF